MANANGTNLRKSTTCISMLWFCFSWLLLSQTSTSLDTLSPGQSIKDGETLVSKGGIFELGFHRLGNSNKRYLAIWYKEAKAFSVVWVANRETPLLDSSGVLSFSKKGLLVLLNGKNSTVWSSNKTTPAQSLLMQLLDTGNLVVNDTQSVNYLWQSFDSPCDTLLPGMRIGRNFSTRQDRFLTSWKSANDPAPGQFSLWIDPRGFPQLVLRNGTAMHYRLGSWNGLRFTGTPQLPAQIELFEYEFELNNNGVYYEYEVKGNLMSRLFVNRSGFVERFARENQSNGWRNLYSAPLDQCDKYSLCGAHMKCDIIGDLPNCVCLEGFVSKSPKNWSAGCVRKTPLDCKAGDIFRSYTGLKLPDTSGSSYNMTMSLAECKEMCTRNCNCTAYANSNIKGSGCLLWFGELADMREYNEGGQNIYIRMSSSKPDQAKKKQIGIIVTSAILVGMLVVGIIVCIQRRKKSMQGMANGIHMNDNENNEGTEDMELLTFDITTITKATNNFSRDNKLGQGGFGPVYKGTLPGGQEIAVKRLSKSSGQGQTEFKTEVILISKLQHRNLVRLLGCCFQKDEKMLIYEFMPNKSLDFFIFDQMRSNYLDWPKRVHIIGGIAKGLLYLHQDSRLRIIHRDLKASNVLLDKDMNPKISDFGMARIFGGDQTEANTNRVAGTYGYMAPEYAVDGLFSMKSDVFSFGALVLEIVSGKKNRGFSHPDHNHNLLGHAWKLWIEERPLELVDHMLDSFATFEVLRCINVGLLCVQQRPEDRPNMSSVVVMLGSESSLPQPKQPGFFTERNMPEAESSSSGHGSTSVNEMSTSFLEPR
ncbi:hypothetical protein P3X46_006744 [Hevea brasiliensis]|uniref:Receptor-like serine/threonine-protein kinase n=1 Tax=Hevea brasiliensis TaxID=3981 RepID=A0ABQ9MR71_HEVBR|nr:G-type lectin S-receptor-like serine/threonine-protein kinase At4g27290 [Hevea brasiliensis]KAJ9182791.1 hypothetical protein P3X46_006744 [Hevea brasiliensis]